MMTDNEKGSIELTKQLAKAREERNNRFIEEYQTSKKNDLARFKDCDAYSDMYSFDTIYAIFELARRGIRSPELNDMDDNLWAFFRLHLL